MALCGTVRDMYSRRQWQTFVVVALCNFSSSLCTSLLALLYPPLATQKGVLPDHFGFVFGAFSFSAMISSFICGKFINSIGAKLMFDMSMFIKAAAEIAFGFLIYIDDNELFFGVSLALRVVAALGVGAVLTARNAIIATEFLDIAGFTFSLLEICIGFGMMVGPTVGGALMEYGGFMLPFIVLGLVQLIACIISVMFLPKHEFVIEKVKRESSITNLLLNPKIILFCFGVFSASFSRGFYEVALENHLHLLGLSPVLIGSMFMLRGGTFTLSSPVIGVLCDKVISPIYVMFIAALCGSIGFLFLGPVPFIPLKPSVTLCVIALSLLGMAGCGELVSGYTGSIKAVLDQGLPDNIVTYGFVSGLWSTAYYLGDFLGPIITGFMIDYVGFGWTSTVILLLHSLVILLITIYLFYRLIYTIFDDSLLEQHPNYCTKYEGYKSIKDIYARNENIDEALYY